MIYKTKYEKNRGVNAPFMYSNDLTAKSKVLLNYLLVSPPDVRTSHQDLKPFFKEGKEALYSAFNELEKKGYIKRSRPRNNGQFTGYDIFIIWLGE